MMRRAALATVCALVLAACATPAPPPGTQADEARLVAATAPGASKASVLAALGPTRSIAFDSGYEVWLYQAPKGNGLYAEYVVLFDPRGVVSRTRQRAAAPVKTN